MEDGSSQTRFRSVNQAIIGKHEMCTGKKEISLVHSYVRYRLKTKLTPLTHNKEFPHAAIEFWHRKQLRARQDS